MLVDGFLAFQDSCLVIALAKFATVLVGYGIERDHLSEVVLVAILLFQTSIDICQSTIIIGIITGIERMPPPAPRSILLRGTTRYCQ